MSVESDPPWMKEYPSEEDSPEEALQATRPTLTPLEATAELTRFRPIHGKPSDFKHLLDTGGQLHHMNALPHTL